MKTWNYALYMSIFSVVILIITFFLPAHYSILSWSKDGADAGKLFPLMLFIWALSLIAFAMNNVFVDKCYVDDNLKMNSLVKYLPSVLSIPVFSSFIWFLFTWLKDNPVN